MTDVNNPKMNPHPTGNTEKDPSDWVSGDDAMTGAQTSYLKTLSEEMDAPDAFEEDLTKAEASRRIDELKGRQNPKPDARSPDADVAFAASLTMFR